jgi:threonine aldolase
VWAVVPPDAIEHALKAFHFHAWDEKRHEVRLMCAFDTTGDDVDRLVEAFKAGL